MTSSMTDKRQWKRNLWARLTVFPLSDLLLQPSWWLCLESAGLPFTSNVCCGAPSANGPTWCTTSISTSTFCLGSSSTSARQSIPSSTACSQPGLGSVSENSCAPTRWTTARSGTRHSSLNSYWIAQAPPPDPCRPTARSLRLLSLCCRPTSHWVWTLPSWHVPVRMEPVWRLSPKWNEK